MANGNLKMLPGQTPYTEEELQQLYRIVSEVAQAEKLIPPDELEDYARQLNTSIACDLIGGNLENRTDVWMYCGSTLCGLLG